MKRILASVLALVMVFALCSFASADDVVAVDKPMEWSFACSATDNTCWADMGRQFGQYLSDCTDGKISVTVYAQDQLTAGNQQEGIQAVIDGSTDMCAHSNLIMSGFDQRLNVVSLPFIFESTDDVDALLGAGGAGYEALAPSSRVWACTCWASPRTASVMSPTASMRSTPRPTWLA